MHSPGLITFHVIFRRFTVAAEFAARAWTIVVNGAMDLLSDLAGKRRATRLRLIGAFHTSAVKVDAFRHIVRHYAASLP